MLNSSLVLNRPQSIYQMLCGYSLYKKIALHKRTTYATNQTVISIRHHCLQNQCTMDLNIFQAFLNVFELL